MIKFLILLAVIYVGVGIALSIYDATQTDEKINWTSKETWLGFLTWPKRFIK